MHGVPRSRRDLLPESIRSGTPMRSRVTILARRDLGALPGPVAHSSFFRVIRPPIRFGSVVFDCDSTLSSIEGIDELSGSRRAEVAELTQAAMRGDVALEEVYGRRLDLIRPTRHDVEALGTRYIAGLVPDAAAVVAGLHAAGITVRVMSGGLMPPVRAVALHLGIAASDVGAVDIRFDAEGRYRGFDAASPLARAGGKRDLLEMWRREIPAPVMLVGDGATDLEARPAADLFVAFAGFVDRPAVTSHADVVIRARSLAPVYTLALGDEAPASFTDMALYGRGRVLLDAQHRHTP